MNPQTNLITYQPEESIPGGLSKIIDVPAEQTALVRRGDDLQILAKPGPHTVRSAWGGLLGRQVPDVWLVDTGPITLHPYFPDLLDANDQLISADMLVLAQVTDVERFFGAVPVGYGSISKKQLEWLLAEKLQQVVRSLVRRYPWESLLHLPEAQKSIEQGLMQSLRATLAEWGMELRSITHLSFQQAKDAVEIERQVQDIRNQLENIRLQAEIEQLQNEQILEHARREFADDVTEADMAELQEKLETEPPDQALQSFQDSVMERLKLIAINRLNRYLEAKPQTKTEAVVEYDETYQRLQDLLSALRILAAIIALVTAYGTVYFPHVIQYNDKTRLLLVSIGFVIALLALISSFIIHRQMHHHRRTARRRLAKKQEAAERAERVAREQGVRRYLEQRLRQVAANCEQTWKRVFDEDIELATSLRNHCCKPYNDLADKVQATDYRTGRYLSQNDVSVDDLTQLLVLTEGVLDQAQAMVQTSQEAYYAATISDLRTVKNKGLELDQGCLAIENAFSERERFLMK